MEQVTNLLVVDFEVGNTDKILLLRVRLDLLEDIFEGAWHDTLLLVSVRHTCDRERFSGTCLSVGEDSTVVALNDILADWVRCLGENFLLL